MILEDSDLDKKTCPLCGSDSCAVEDGVNFTQLVKCKTYGTAVHISDEIFEDFSEKPIFTQMMNLIAERILRNKTAANRAYWVFYYAPTEGAQTDNPAFVNLAPLIDGYPKSVIEKAERVLLNLAELNPDYGVGFGLDPYYYRLYFPKNEEQYYLEESGITKILTELGYMAYNPENNSYVSITVNGWKHIEELRKNHSEVKQGFIAVKFGNETEEIREAIKAGIRYAGFEPMIIDEKEHNNQIVPEILYEIGKSKFLVIDVTYPNFGAYYEAGYAQGLGKEVIVCCSNEVFDNKEGNYQRPHFDIAQKSQIRWSDTEDLKTRLKRRIEATVQF